MPLLDTLLAPGYFVANRLGLRAKLAIIGLIFLIPSIVIVQQIYQHHADQIREAGLHRLGIAQLQPARALLGALADHRGFAQLDAAMVAGAAVKAQQATRNVDIAFSRIESAQRAQNDVLGTAAELAALQKAWQEFLQGAPAMDAAENFARHGRLIRQAMEWTTAVADRAGLVTDEELDSHYLIIMVLNRLPMLAEAIASLRGQAAPLLAQPSVSAREFAEINRRMGEVRATTRIVERGLERVRLYNPRANVLFDDFRHLGVLAAAFQSKASEVILDPAALHGGPRELFALGSQVIAKADQLHAASLALLDTLMLERIEYHQRWLAIDLGVFLACLLAGVYFLAAVLRGLRRSIATIEEGSRRLANADFSAPFLIRSQDEFGLLGARLDDMRRQLDATRDATEKRQAHRNAMIVNAAMDGFFVTDMSTRFLDCNEIYCAMLGYSREEMLGLRVADIEAIESPEQVAAHARNILEKGVDRFDTHHRRKDGSLLDVEVNVILGENDGVPTLFAFVHDISRRKRDEAALRVSRDEAEQARAAAENANAAKSEFLSRMSHELRTPLNAIIGFAQLLDMTGKGMEPQQADNVREILHAGRHLLTQVNEVLDLSRVESGRLELSLEPLPIAALARDCIAQLRPLADKRAIAVESALDEALAVQGDATRVRQVLINLLSNAIKYNRDGGTIRIVAVPDGENLRIEVHDSGRGIPPDQIGRLFNPFERLESAYEGVEGTGIGLALVKKLVEAMGGAIGADSKPGVGSRFWFALPRAELPLSLPESVPPAKVGAGGTAPGTVPDTSVHHVVLYIEDNPANLKLVRKILGPRPDIDLIEANTATAGLELAQTRAPAAILLDLNLPDMDGFTVMRRLQENPATRDIPVIAVSANAMRHEIERGQAAGFRNYLTKPLDIRLFVEALERCLAADGKETA